MTRICADASWRFPRHARIRKPGEFTTCFDLGSAVNGRYFRWILLPAAQRKPSVDAATHRLGLAVSKKVDKRAVGRNRIKRLVREWFRYQRQRLPSCDLVVVAKPAAKTADPQLLRDDLHAMARRCRALKPEGGRGTMPGLAAPEVAPASDKPASEP